MNYSELAELTGSAAAVRRRQRLQPVGGPNDTIYPPTYPGEGRSSGPRHVYEVRRINGADLVCVLIDSVQSQANRMEEALQAAIEREALPIPHIVVDFRNQGLTGVSEITSLQAPHRVYDAILRDSLLDDTPFMESGIGRELALASPADAGALLTASPTALLFGAWHSTGGGGGIGAKFARVLVSEIIAVNVPVEPAPSEASGYVQFKAGEEASGEVRFKGASKGADTLYQTAGRRTSSRIDPLGILRKVEVYQDDSKTWDTKKFGKAKQVRPSEINHGNIAPSVAALGITCDYAEHTAVLSLAGLRRLRFGGGVKDTAGRAMIAALGITALLEQDAYGYALRSRCDLVCDGAAPLEIVLPDGSAQPIKLTLDTARKLYREAYEAAKKVGFEFPHEPLRLKPQDKLVAIVKESQKQALHGQGGDDQENA